MKIATGQEVVLNIITPTEEGLVSWILDNSRDLDVAEGAVKAILWELGRSASEVVVNRSADGLRAAGYTTLRFCMVHKELRVVELSKFRWEVQVFSTHYGYILGDVLFQVHEGKITGCLI